MQRIPDKFKPAIIAFAAFMVGIIIISILAISGVFHRNPYGAETKIDNFSKYFRGTPTSTQDMIFKSLHNIAALNVADDEKVPTTATIRNQSAENTYNSETDIHTGTFIADIEAIQQSFKVWFEWSDDQDNPNLSGYQLSITCLIGNESLYGSTTCDDGSKNTPIQNLYSQYPFLSQFPLDVSYYSNNYASYTSYQLSYEANESDTNITIIITDYTGNSYQAALTKLRELGANTSSLTIEYKNIAPDESFGRPPDGN